MNTFVRGFRTLAILAVSLPAMLGCYHATVQTGLTPSPQQERVEKLWAHSFLGGLVPPNEVRTDEICPTGVSQVETKLSFLNLVAGSVTFGIYTPMTIVATCADARVDR